jgi:hypothetical protein
MVQSELPILVLFYAQARAHLLTATNGRSGALATALRGLARHPALPWALLKRPPLRRDRWKSVGNG